jgi:hypothetical protein
VRRTVALITSAVLIAVAVTAVALAFESAGGSGAGAGDHARSADPVRSGEPFPGRRGGRHGFGLLRGLLDGVAERLDVSPEQLREAIRGVKRRGLDRAVDEGIITAAERDALLACRSRDRASCDREAARSAARKLHRARHRRGGRGLARMKTRILGDLAAELGKPVEEVTRAVRAELVEALDRAVAMGFLSGRGRELALACFDRPRSCDLRELRGEAFGRFGHGGPGHRGGFGPRRGP